MQKTTKYQLNQWAPEDRILRADFNRDNKNLENALSGLEDAVAAERSAREAAVAGAKAEAVAELEAKLTKFASGSYTGSGSTSKSLTFTFPPRVVIIVTNEERTFYGGTVLLRGQTKSSSIGSVNNISLSNKLTLTWSENTLSWTSSGEAENALNESGTTYYYLAIG